MDKKFILTLVIIVISVWALLTSLFKSISNDLSMYEAVYKADYKMCVSYIEGKPSLADLALCKELASGASPMFIPGD